MSETSENVYLFYFMIGFLWSLDSHTIFVIKIFVINKINVIKRKSKVQEKNMSCERALNFDQ